MKVFEDYFSELQSDMVSICLEYVDNEAEEIYILFLWTNNVCIWYLLQDREPWGQVPRPTKERLRGNKQDY